MVLALRRRESENETQVYSIKGVDKNKQYQLENADGGSKLLSGEELINGLEISIPHKEGSALIFFSASITEHRYLAKKNEDIKRGNDEKEGVVGFRRWRCHR